jgi:hypothetical protein
MKIHNYKPIANSVMVAQFDVEIEQWALTIRGCTLFDKGGKKWIGFPSRKFDGKDGKPAYFNYIVMDKEAKERFDKAAIALLDAKAYEEASGGAKAPVTHPIEQEVPW